MADPERGPRDTWQHLGLWRNGQLDLGATLAELPASDLKAAILLAAERPGELHHCPGPDQWYIWDQRCHRPDDASGIDKLTADLAVRFEQLFIVARAALAAEVRAQMAGAEERQIVNAVDAAWKAWEGPRKYGAALQKSAGQRSLRTYLAVVCGTPESAFDSNRVHELNCWNGTVDLATGRIRPHDPADMLTYCLPYSYRPELVASAHRFGQVLWHVACDDGELATYLTKLLGYSLFGHNNAQKIIFLHGPTASGKSILLTMAGLVLGDLAHSSTHDLITWSRNGRNARVEWSIVGKRFVSITEAAEKMNLDEAQIKRLTGESWISVNRHYSKVEIKTRVTWTIFDATNEMGTLTGFDAALRRRTIIFPCGQPIPEDQRRDGIAEQIVAEEAEAILAVLVWGAMEAARSGLAMPLRVQLHTDQYAAEQDTVSQWAADCCQLTTGYPAVPGQPGPAVPFHIPRADAWKSYRGWAPGTSHLAQSSFFERLGQVPGVTFNKERRRFEGIVLTDAAREWLSGESS